MKHDAYSCGDTIKMVLSTATYVYEKRLELTMTVVLPH